jgi:hypothetical protein
MWAMERPAQRWSRSRGLGGEQGAASAQSRSEAATPIVGIAVIVISFGIAGQSAGPPFAIRDRKKFKAGIPLSPILLVPYERNGKVVVADGITGCARSTH